jgi:hypothetical protein
VAAYFPTFKQNNSGNAATVKTNANLTGPITSVGNATSIASQTGTGTKFVVDTSPTIITPTVTTSATVPLVIGGTGTTSPLTLRSTSGTGTTGADIIFQAGTNGGTEVARVFNSGKVGIGTGSTAGTNCFTVVGLDNGQFSSAGFQPLNKSQTFSIGYNGTSSSTSAIYNAANGQYHEWQINGGAQAHLDATGLGLGLSGSGAAGVLDVGSTTHGIIPPRMSTTQRTAISATQGEFMYDTTTTSMWFWDLGVSAWANIIDSKNPTTFNHKARTSGVASYFTLNPPADTGITANTESIGYQHTAATRTWADGTVALQRERYFAGPTYAKTTTSATFTDVFNTYLDAPIAGTGVTFTRPHTLGIVDSTSASSSITGGLVVSTTVGTTATSVGIGGGNVNAGGTITAGGTLTSGAITVSDASAPTITLNSGGSSTGYLRVNGKTSGAVFYGANDTGQLMTLAWAYQTTGSASAVVPNLAGTTRNFVMDTQTQTLTNKTMTSPVLNSPTVNGPAIWRMASASTTTISASSTYTHYSSSGAAYTMTLPTAAAALEFTFENIDSTPTTNTLSILTSASGQYIDGADCSSNAYVLSTQYAKVTLRAIDATHWRVISCAGDGISTFVSGYTTTGSATFQSMGSITLSPGSWLLSCTATMTPGSGSISGMELGVSTSNSTYSGNAYGDNAAQLYTSFGVRASLSIPSYPITVTASTPIYLVLAPTYSGTACTVNGRISAVRVR